MAEATGVDKSSGWKVRISRDAEGKDGALGTEEFERNP